jgi:hypothetical protein
MVVVRPLHRVSRKADRAKARADRAGAPGGSPETRTRGLRKEIAGGPSCTVAMAHHASAVERLHASRLRTRHVLLLSLKVPVNPRPPCRSSRPLFSVHVNLSTPSR